MKLSFFSNATLLLAAAVIPALVVLGNAYSSANGYISPDSANYLRLAERLLDGHGLHVPANGRIGPEEVWFAIWPPGYSMIIAAVSLVTGASTFLAAKIVNVLLLSGSLLLLYRFLGRAGVIAGTVLLSAGTLHIFSMTWSEAPFLASLIALCLCTAAVVNGKFRVGGVLLVMLPLLMILPFAFRYIGVFVFAPVGLAALHLYFGGRRGEAWRLLLAAGIALTLCVLFLWNNWLQTGYLTGVDRIAAPESHATLLRTFLIAALREMTLPLIAWLPWSLWQSLVVLAWAIPALLLGVKLIRAGRTPVTCREAVYSLYFGLFGAFYLSSIAFLRWNAHFDGFSNRLLDPGFSLLSIGAVIWLLGAYRQHVRTTSTFFIATALLSVSLSLAGILSRPGFGIYAAQSDQATARYAQLPDDAIVVFGENALVYLRPDIQLASPRYRPYASEDESWLAFLKTLQGGVPVYAETGPRARNPNRYHPSVRDAVKSLPEDKLVKIAP